MTTRQPLYKSLYFQVIVAIAIGILLGHFYPQTGVALKPLGDGFINCLLYTSPSPRDRTRSRMPSSA